MNRLNDLARFYALLAQLRQRLGGARTLVAQDSLDGLPKRGVYFFFEPGEARTHSGEGSRVVRIGTHALGVGSRSTLRQRLGQHRGHSAGGGNHRGSIFRLLVGQALLERGGFGTCTSWGVKGDVSKASAILQIETSRLTEAELSIEQAVSSYLREMPFLWLDIDDEPGSNSDRGVTERNCIALVSNYERDELDPPSTGWLGLCSNREKVRYSGLWNQRHVEEKHDPLFLDTLQRLIR